MDGWSNYHIHSASPHGREDGRTEWRSSWTRSEAADIIVVCTPIWFGVGSSVALVIERLEDVPGAKQGRPYPVQQGGGGGRHGNEDGAHSAAETKHLQNMTPLGCTVPPTPTRTGSAMRDARATSTAARSPTRAHHPVDGAQPRDMARILRRTRSRRRANHVRKRRRKHLASGLRQTASPAPRGSVDTDRPGR